MTESTKESNDSKIEYREVKSKFSPTGIDAYLGKVRIASIYQSSLNSKSDSKAWRVSFTLPGFKKETLPIGWKDEGKEIVERRLKLWLEWTGTTNDLADRGKQSFFSGLAVALQTISLFDEPGMAGEIVNSLGSEIGEFAEYMKAEGGIDAETLEWMIRNGVINTCEQ